MVSASGYDLGRSTAPMGSSICDKRDALVRDSRTFEFVYNSSSIAVAVIQSSNGLHHFRSSAQVRAEAVRVGNSGRWPQPHPDPRAVDCGFTVLLESMSKVGNRSVAVRGEAKIAQRRSRPELRGRRRPGRDRWWCRRAEAEIAQRRSRPELRGGWAIPYVGRRIETRLRRLAEPPVTPIEVLA